MAEKTSYIRIDRNIVHWRWWNDHNTVIVFLYLLIKANIVDNGFSGQNIRRGQLATSLPSLCNSTGLTIMQVRTALQHLKSTGEITVKRFPKFQVITIVNYNKYQDLTGKTSYKQQSSNSQVTVKQHQLEKIENIEKVEKNNNRFAQNPKFPCGVSEKPDWLDEDTWEQIKYCTTDNIPGSEQGFYDTYIDYVREHEQGGVIE